ncbi:MAG: PIN domain-containing protein [Bacteroidota bacterium]
MSTISQQLKEDAEALAKGIETLLGPDRKLRDVNVGGSVVLVGASYAFGDLPLESQRLRSKLLVDLDHLFDVAAVLLARQAASVRKHLDQDRNDVHDIVAQTHLTWHSTTGKALESVRMALDRTISAIQQLHDPLDGGCLLVPDTNALIAVPVLTDWALSDGKQFEIVFVPTVLAELDTLKVEHRNPDVRDKAKKVINQLKELRRRGNLSNGVPLVSQRSGARTLAVEPDFTTSLPWLDPSIPDDRMLASAIEVIRHFPRSAVLLVTGDINLQNKADFARMPLLDVEDVTG